MSDGATLANGQLTPRGHVVEVLDQLSSFGFAPVCDNCGVAGGDDQDEPYPCPDRCGGTVSWRAAAKVLWWTIERTREQLWYPREAWTGMVPESERAARHGSTR